MQDLTSATVSAVSLSLTLDRRKEAFTPASKRVSIADAQASSHKKVDIQLSFTNPSSLQTNCVFYPGKKQSNFNNLDSSTSSDEKYQADMTAVLLINIFYLYVIFFYYV